MRIIIFLQRRLFSKMERRNRQCFNIVSMTTPKCPRVYTTNTQQILPTRIYIYIRDLGDGFYIECFKSMKYHHLFASICSPYHLFYTVRFAMCIPFTDHIAPPRSPIAPRDMRYDIRDISFTFVAIGQYMDLHLNIVHTRDME